MHTFSQDKVEQILGGGADHLDADDRRAAAVLVSIGAISTSDLQHPDEAADKLSTFAGIINAQHPALVGRLGNVVDLLRPKNVLDYDRSEHGNQLRAVLRDLLTEGVITGYDLRQKGVYEDVPGTHKFIYSHSSWDHLRQLMALLQGEGVRGWVYVTPKISGYLYRPGWGQPPEKVVILTTGVRVIQDQEFATLFVFDSAEDQARFHELVLRYAKKDAQDSKTVLEDAWWQPFYYTLSKSEALADFQQISLVVLSSKGQEATLTVLKEKTREVVDALRGRGWATQVEQVWVNPAFFRFLEGGSN